MLDETKLLESCEIIYNRNNYFENYTLQTIGRRIKDINSMSAYDQTVLKNYIQSSLNEDIASIENKLAQITKLNIKDVHTILTQTVSDGINYYQPLYDYRGLKNLDFANNKAAQKIVEHFYKETAGTMINLSKTKALAFDRYNSKGEVIGSIPFKGAIEKAYGDAVMAVTNGTVDFQTAMRETIKNIGGSGVRVQYPRTTRNLNTCIRANILYGAKKAAMAYDEYVSNELGCDGIEIEYHPHPRESHSFMGGKIYSLNGRKTVNGVTYEDASEALARLEDYGCLHTKSGVILGVSVPRYDEKWIEEQKEKDKELIEYDGQFKTKNEWQIKQRKLENATRKQYNTMQMAKVSGNNILAKDCEDKINIFKDKYTDLCDKVGLEKRYNRMASYNSRSSSIKPLTYNKNDGIIRNDIQIYKSLGAAAFRDTVKLPNGNKGKIKEGSKITKVVTFAGEGTNKPIKVANHLEKQYNVPASEWKKSRGDGYVICDDGIERHAELHWFESEKTGRIKMKVKRYFDD